MKHTRILGLLGAATAAALALAGCSSDSAESGDKADAGKTGDKGSVSIAAASGWEEGIAVSEMWKIILEEKGYDVDVTYLEAGPLYQGLADGDFDIFLDAWLPDTHAEYMSNYEDSLTSLGSWNDDAVLTLAVNEDAPIDSIEELADNADLFDNKIIGIEAGAGLTKKMQEQVIPGYGLDDMEFVVSSAPAMLTELKAATDAGDNVVVTLWRPHWAYEAFPIKDLKDPKGTLGTAEHMEVIANKDFVEAQPEVAGWFENFHMDSEQLFSLENALFNENDDPTKYPEITKQWMTENADYIATLTE